MPIQISQGGNIPNIYPGSPEVFSKNKKESVYNVIGMLEYSQIFQNASGTLQKNKDMRIDMQGTFVSDNQKFHNLQVQVNGINGNSTVAHVNVSESTMTDNEDNQRGVVRKVHSALNQSFDNGDSYTVTGTAPWITTDDWYLYIVTAYNKPKA